MLTFGNAVAAERQRRLYWSWKLTAASALLKNPLSVSFYETTVNQSPEKDLQLYFPKTHLRFACLSAFTPHDL